MTLRVLVVSHSCIVDVNQTLFVELARQPGVEVGLVVPAEFETSLRGRLTFQAHPELRAQVFAEKPWLAGALGRLGDKGFHLWLYPRAEQIVREFRPDVVHLDEEPYSLTAWQFARAAKKYGARVTFYTKQNLVKQFPWPFNQIERAVFKLADAAVALTDDVAQVLRRKGYAGPLRVIAHAVDTRDFHPRPESALRAELGQGEPLIGYLGRLTAAKGVFDLVEALAVLRGQGRPARAVFIGRGPDEAALRERVAALGLEENVAFLPAVPHNQVAQYYAALDVVAVPSRTQPGWKEQFGRVIIEANACGTPVVGSDSGAVPEVIRATGGGLVVPEGDPATLAHALGAVLGDQVLRGRLAAAGQAAVAGRYTYPVIAGQFLRVFQSLIAF